MISPPAQAADGLIVKPSRHSVDETLDRLVVILRKKGISIFSRVSHRANARKIKQKMPPTQVLIFGNPKMGTPLMLSNRTIGIDLPMKALAWQDAKGKVWLAYNSPNYLAKRHGITDRDKVFKKMGAVLKKLTDKAVN